MSHYSFLFEPEAEEVCEECEAEIRKERALEQWRNAPLPSYDIDAIIGPPGRKAHQIVGDLYRVFYHVTCPETALFEAEVVIRDFCEFNQFSGHDLDYILGLNRGDQILLCGQRAFKAIGASKMARFIAEFLKIAEANGLKFPNPLPDPWLSHMGEISDDVKQVLSTESTRLCSEIDPYEDRSAGYFCELLIDYVMKHIELLRERKPKAESESIVP